MSRVLEVAMRNTILALVRQGWSYRRIHRELGVDRETVAKYALLADSKPANLPTGSPDLQVKTGQACPPGSASVVEPFRQVVEGKLLEGLDALRIFQDLRGEHGYAGAYDAVKRFVRQRRDVLAEARWAAEYRLIPREALEEATWPGITEEEWIGLRQGAVSEQKRRARRGLRSI